MTQYFTLRGKPLSWFSLRALEWIQKYQDSSSGIVKGYGKRIISFFRRRGIFLFVGKINDNEYIGVGKFFETLSTSIRSSKEVWMCMGEMGFRIMERDDVLEAIEYAARHKSKVSIVHGPRVDPRTSRIFTLAQKGLVHLYMMNYYPSDHFICVQDKVGRVTLFDESPHPEVVRAKSIHNGVEKIFEIYRGRYRLFYVIPNPGWLWARRLKAVKRRAAYSSKITSRPNTPTESRGYPFFYILFSLIFWYTPLIYIVQPATIAYRHYVGKVVEPIYNIMYQEHQKYYSARIAPSILKPLYGNLNYISDAYGERNFIHATLISLAQIGAAILLAILFLPAVTIQFGLYFLEYIIRRGV